MARDAGVGFGGPEAVRLADLGAAADLGDALLVAVLGLARDAGFAATVACSAVLLVLSSRAAASSPVLT